MMGSEALAIALSGSLPIILGAVGYVYRLHHKDVETLKQDCVKKAEVRELVLDKLQPFHVEIKELADDIKEIKEDLKYIRRKTH